MRNANADGIERFKKCRRCQGTNTKQIGVSDNESHLVFIAWCWDCNNESGYRLIIEDVQDKEGRI